MRALAGPAMLAVIIGGFFLTRQCAAEKTPPRDFTALELEGADESGTCYSLSTVLVAHRAFNKPIVTWESPAEGKWKVKMESVVQGYAGPEHLHRTLTFEQAGDKVRLVAVDASKNQPDTIDANIDDLLDSPNALGSTPVDRCGKNGGTGYKYKPR